MSVTCYAISDIIFVLKLNISLELLTFFTLVKSISPIMIINHELLTMCILMQVLCLHNHLFFLKFLDFYSRFSGIEICTNKYTKAIRNIKSNAFYSQRNRCNSFSLHCRGNKFLCQQINRLTVVTILV